MVDRDYGRRIDKDQYDPRKQNDLFEDEDVEEDVDPIQEPYAYNEKQNKDITDAEVENPDEHHEYDDKDHPHQTQPPVANVDYSGNRTNTFEQQNPLQSTFPSSDRDRR